MSVMNPYKDAETTAETKSTRPTAGLLSGVQTFGSIEPGTMKKRREGMKEMRDERKAKKEAKKAEQAGFGDQSKMVVDNTP